MMRNSTYFCVKTNKQKSIYYVEFQREILKYMEGMKKNGHLGRTGKRGTLFFKKNLNHVHILHI